MKPSGTGVGGGQEETGTRHHKVRGSRKVCSPRIGAGKQAIESNYG